MTELLPMREQIARIIDPSSWRVMDSYLEQAKRKYAGQDVGWPEDQFWHHPSLAKADAILALRAAPASPEGWVMVPRTSLQQIEDWFRDYERQHRAKCSAEGDAKALTNRDRADFIAAMIAAAPGVVGGGDSSSVAESGGTASPKSENQCKSEGAG